MNVGRFINGLLIIAVGLLLLANTTGLISWSIWRELLRFWPILLILAGVSILLGGRTSAFGTLIAVLVIGGVVYLVFGVALGWGDYCNWWRGGSQSLSWMTVSQSLPADAETATISLKFGAGKLWLEAGQSGTLIEGTLGYLGDRPEERMELLDGGCRVDYRISHGMTGPGTFTGQEWDLRLTPHLPTSLILDIGACQAELNLTGVKLTKLDINVGASDLEIRLGDHGLDTEVDIKCGASSIDLYVPSGVGLRVRLTSALASNNLGEAGLAQNDEGYWVTAGYDEATTKVIVTIDAAASSFRLHR